MTPRSSRYFYKKRLIKLMRKASPFRYSHTPYVEDIVKMMDVRREGNSDVIVHMGTDHGPSFILTEPRLTRDSKILPILELPEPNGVLVVGSCEKPLRQTDAVLSAYINEQIYIDDIDTNPETNT